MSECITASAAMFILGYIIGFITIGIFNGRQYNKGYTDGKRDGYNADGYRP